MPTRIYAQIIEVYLYPLFIPLTAELDPIHLRLYSPPLCKGSSKTKKTTSKGSAFFAFFKNAKLMIPNYANE